MYRLFRYVILFAILMTSLAHAQSSDPPSREEFEALKQRMVKLEELAARQQQTIRDQEALLQQQGQSLAVSQEAEVEATLPVPAAGLPGWLSIGGLVEAEAAWDKVRDRDTSATSSDITLATLELAIGITVNEWIRGDAVLLWEEDATEPVDLDIAMITLGNHEVFPLSLSVGKLYVPFGTYETHFISDPLTLEIGETRESAAVLNGIFGPLTTYATIFNGDASPDERSHVSDFVMAAYFEQPLTANTSLTIGGSYLSNLADSDALQDELTVASPDDRVGAWHASLHLACKGGGLIGEYLAATDGFARGEMAFAEPGDSPRLEAWSIEGYLRLTDAMTLAARYDGTSEAGSLLPAKRYGLAWAYALFATDSISTVLSLEYAHAIFDDLDRTRQDTISAQLAIGF